MVSFFSIKIYSPPGDIRGGKAGKWNKKVAPAKGTERERETDRVKQWRGKTKRKSNGRLSHGKAGIRFGHKGKRTKATHSKWGKVLAKATFKSKLFVFLSVSWIVYVCVSHSLVDLNKRRQPVYRLRILLWYQLHCCKKLHFGHTEMVGCL